MTTAADAAAALLGDRAQRDVALAPFTTFRLGGPAALLVRAEAIDDLDAVAAASSTSGLPVLCIGQGSNLLVSDDGFEGIVVVLGDGFADITIPADPTDGIDGTDPTGSGDPEHRAVVAGGAVKLPVLARRTVAAGLTGLEWAVGVPGSVGGAVAMNAGGHGSDVAANLRDATLYRLGGPHPGAVVVPAADLHLAYRSSVVDATVVVVEATFVLRPGDRERGEAELGEIVRWRRQHQPGGANCGSVFTNPPGASAGRLIDEAGLKGHRIGTASVSEKHANFIQADEGGHAQDVRALINYVRATVLDRTGIALHPEVRTVGFGDHPFEETP